MREKTRILFVDDEPEACDEFSVYLMKKNYRVSAVNNGLEAVRVVKNERIDVVITDYKMPGMNGLELIRELKSINSNIPVILISGDADIKTAVKSLREEAFDFLYKPVNSKELLKVINSAIFRSKRKIVEEEIEDEDSRYYGPVKHVIMGELKDISVIHIYKSLDEHSKSAIALVFHRMMMEGLLKKKVIFSLKHVPYMNNVGLNLLIDLRNELDNRGYNLIMTNLSDPVYKYMYGLGYCEYFEVGRSFRDAIEFFQGLSNWFLSKNKINLWNINFVLYTNSINGMKDGLYKI